MPEPNSRVAQLRAGTRSAHARIETAPALVRLVADDLGRNEYVVILQHLQALHTHLEPVLAATLETLPEAAAMLDGDRPRRLAEDLAWFGAPALPPPPLPEMADTAAALGALYVIEGSGLGGRVIGRHLPRCLGVTPGKGGSFFCGLDAEVARSRWDRLTAMLEALPVEDNASADFDARIVASARDTFGFFERCFRRIEVAPDSGHVMAEAVAP